MQTVCLRHRRGVIGDRVWGKNYTLYNLANCKPAGAALYNLSIVNRQMLLAKGRCAFHTTSQSKPSGFASSPSRGALGRAGKLCFLR